MSPEEHVQQAAAALADADSLDEIDRLLGDLEFVYQALQPELQELAGGLIEQLQEKRREVGPG